MPLDKPKFAKKSDGLHANVCKKSVRPPKINNPIPDSSKNRYQKIVLKIPDEYAFALQEMYPGKGMQGAIMEHIRSTVVPINLDTCKSCEKGLCPDGRGGFISCTICGRSA